MANPWKKRAFEYNRKLAQEREAAADMQTIAGKMSELPPGQLKKLLDEQTVAILEKYGVKINE